MGLLDRLLRRRPRSTDVDGVDPTAETAPRRAVGSGGRPIPGKADTLPPTADTLVVYALEHADAAPDGKTRCMVVLDFDPVDVRRVFDATDRLGRSATEAFRARLASPGALRDPNSRGRLEFVRRWLAEHEPPHVGWRLEPVATAGTGALPE